VKGLGLKFMAYGLHGAVGLFAAAMISLGLLAPESEHSSAYLGLGLGGLVLIAGMIWMRRLIEAGSGTKEGGKES
jgi:hypothetical protein